MTVKFRTVVPASKAKFPFIVPVPFNVNTTLFPLAPRVKVLPLATLSVVVIVNVLPEVPAARRELPLTVKLFKVIVGTAVIFALWSLLMITSSFVAGAPLGLQLPAVVQAPPAVGTHVLVAAAAKFGTKRTAKKNKEKLSPIKFFL